MTPITPAEIGELIAGMETGFGVYFVGIGGCGMSGLAHMMLDLGCKVSGSDLAENSETRQLSERGATVHIGHAGGQLLAARPRLVVYTPAIRRDNPELAAAEQFGAPIIRRAVLLAALMRRQRGICVAGMHGKTTTSAMLAFALERLAADPSYAIGAAVPQLARAARLGGCRVPAQSPSGERAVEDLPGLSSVRGLRSPEHWFVAETDESDGTLPLFEPEHAIVLNVDEEHLDYYANLEAICADFTSLTNQTTGTVVYCADDPNLVRLLAGKDRSISYGFNPAADYRIEWRPANGHGTTANVTSFEIWMGRTRLGGFSIRLAGEKNISNAAGVIALLHRMGYSPDEILRAIAPFQGAARRQQLLFEDARFRVVDDYGHHPQEIRATLRALKDTGCGRLLVAFQPHRYTRTRALLAQFATSFAAANQLWLADVYAASEDEIPGANSAALASAVRAAGQSAEHVGKVENLVLPIRKAMMPDDLVLFLGAGDITHAAHILAANLRKERSTMKEAFSQTLTASLSGEAVIRRDEPLAKRTTLRVGGPADFYVEPASEDDLRVVIRLCRQHAIPWRILGRGSNLLVRDGGFRGLIVSLGHPHFSSIEMEDGLRMRCGAGARLKDVAHVAKRQNIGGLEFLEGIPGSIGGALRMNAGAMGTSTFEAVESVWFMDAEGMIHHRKVEEMEFQYRSCPLFKAHIALGSVLRGTVSPSEEIHRKMDECSRKRWTSQPKQSSAGCMFKNPESIPAGRLIDELGLKGLRIGGAVVSDVHGNFIVNEGHATAQEVLDLIEHVRARVRELRGIELHTEVEIIGENAKMD